MVGGIANKRLNQDLIESITTHKKHYFRSNKHVYAGLRSMILDYRSVFCNYRDNSIFNNIFVILWPSYLLVFLLVIIKFLFFIKWTKSAFSKMCNAMYILCYHFLSEPQQIKWLLCNTKWAIFQPYHCENKLHSMKWWWVPFSTKPTRWVGYLCASLLK